MFQSRGRAPTSRTEGRNGRQKHRSDGLQAACTDESQIQQQVVRDETVRDDQLKGAQIFTLIYSSEVKGS